MEVAGVGNFPTVCQVTHKILHSKWTGKEEAPYKAGDLGSVPGLGRSPEEGNSNPLQYSCLENPMDRESGVLQPMVSQRVGHD